LESGRLFGSYKNGSIAVICDSGGNGSVMDQQGHNVLLLTSNASTDGVAVAKVLDPKSGKLLAEYRDDDGTKRAGEGIQDPEEQAEAVNGGSAYGGVSHSWKFGGFLIEFIPDIWDLRVRFGNERLVCEFSSKTGGKLVREKEAKERDNKGKGKGKGSAAAGGGGNLAFAPASAAAIAAGKSPPAHSRLLDKEDHESVRKDVSSILSNLDSLLKDLGNKADSSKPAGTAARRSKAR
jgi:hypothetical protein